MQNEIDKFIARFGNEHGADDHVHAVITAAINDVGNLSAKDIERALKFVETNEADNPATVLTFVVPGDPPISKRPRSVRMKGKDGEVTGIRVYAADADDQLSVREYVARQLPHHYIPVNGEVELQLNIYRPMLASWVPYKRLLAEMGYIRPESKPDYDNFSKIITDALRGIVFTDDGQVVVGNVNLNYSLRPRLEITVSGRSKRMNK